MALELKYAPPPYQSAHGDIIYTVADTVKVADPDTYPNFKFFIDVYIGGVNVARIQKVPDPTTGIGIFDIGPIVRNYLSAAFNPTAGALVAEELGDGQFTVSVTAHFGEEWDYIPTPDVLVDSTRIFFNNYNKRLYSTTSSLIGRTDQVISNRAYSSQVLLSSGMSFVSYFPTSTAAVPVTVAVSGGGSGFVTSFTPSAANTLQLLNLSPGALNAIHPGAITGATDSYTVTIGSQTYRFQVVCESIYQPYMVHFLNQYGGFDSKVFNKASKRTYDITRKDYGKIAYTVGSDGVPTYLNANKVHNETTATYSSQFSEKMSLNTDVLSDEEYTWLADLLISPLVYIEDNGEFFAVQITDNTYEQKRYAIDDITNLTINIQFGNQLNSQYR